MALRLPKIHKPLFVTTLVALTLISPLATVSAATPSQVREAQTIMTKFGVPTGPIDGEAGPLTKRGMCTVRQITGFTPNRNGLSSELLDVLRFINKKYGNLAQIPAPKLDGHTTYLLVRQKCQVMIYVEDGKYQRIMPVSTGMSASQSGDGKNYRTPTGAYELGHTQRGWSCSTKYPESCSNHTAGEFAYKSPYGNMYNKRHVADGIYVHGSTNVPAYPASHGCIRVTITDSDWMWHHVGNHGTPYIKIVSSY